MEPALATLTPRTLTGRGLANVKLWLALAFVFAILNRNESAPHSPLWFTEFVLFGLMALGIMLRERASFGLPLRLSAGWAAWAYVALVWCFGMTYELSLTVNGEGIGGMHQQTLASFLLAQGDYIPIALTSLAMIHFGRLSFHQVWFFAVGIALTEGLIFMGVLLQTILSPMFFLAPLVLSYYAFVYASFIAMPLLYLDEQPLWRAGPKHDWGSVPLVVLGFVLGIVIRLFWGLVYGPLVESWFDLPRNIM